MIKPLHFAHELIRSALTPGSIAVDATCGNGNDTLFMARLVAPSGRVYAFDIQEQAINSTYQKLQSNGLQENATLIRAGHEERSHWPSGTLQAVMFNLGYLPGGDHTVVTKPESTVGALKIAVERLQPGGIVTLVIYTGHPGGDKEYRAVYEFCSMLSQKDYTVLEYKFINQVNKPPLLLAVRRR